MGEAAIPAMDALLASMRDEGGERYDAAGWHYLETLARHAAEHEGSVRRLLEAKLEKAAAAFSERFAQARSVAAGIVATTGEEHPQAATDLQRLFAQGDFQALRHLRATLAAREQCAALTGLVSQLEPAPAAAPGHATTLPASVRAADADASTRELKTVRESRATWARLSVDRQLSMAMQQAPKNAGPINSHMLVLRSLTMMQDISPDYLSCLVSYFDTLLALDPGEKEVPVARKKASPSKAAKPAKAVRKS